MKASMVWPDDSHADRIEPLTSGPANERARARVFCVGWINKTGRPWGGEPDGLFRNRSPNKTGALVCQDLVLGSDDPYSCCCWG